MKLSDLFPKAMAGDARADLIVTSATDDSRQVRYGSVFFARSGGTVSGVDFVRQAAARGAQAVVVPAGTPQEALGLSEYERAKVAVIESADVARDYALTLSRLMPERPAHIAGITGTNGKTSIASFVKDLWAHDGRTAMSLGTLGLRSHGRVHSDVEAVLTTFDPGTLHLTLSEIARNHAVTDLVMEVSSHALDQRRVDGLTFDVAAFSNLSQDHLDYHGTMEAYFAAKRRLFTDLLAADGVAVVNIDEAHGERVAETVRARGCRVITCSGRGLRADLSGQARRPKGEGQVLTAEIFGVRQEFHIPIAGAFQMENVLCAIGIAVAGGVDPEAAIAHAARLEPVPGRAEHVTTLPNGAQVFVDYAHTPAALETILSSLRPHVGEGGRLHVVFGCGGDRDATKRAPMGRAAVEGADIAWVTDDNPRSEAPEAIRAAICAQVKGAVDAGDREHAIRTALGDLRFGDVLLVAGKGHEDYQILPAPTPDNPKATRKTVFSDQATIRRLSEML